MVYTKLGSLVAFCMQIMMSSSTGSQASSVPEGLDIIADPDLVAEFELAAELVGAVPPAAIEISVDDSTKGWLHWAIRKKESALPESLLDAVSDLPSVLMLSDVLELMVVLVAELEAMLEVIGKIDFCWLDKLVVIWLPGVMPMGPPPNNTACVGAEPLLVEANALETGGSKNELCCVMLLDCCE